jgi:hypothetical protein
LLGNFYPAREAEWKKSERLTQRWKEGEEMPEPVWIQAKSVPIHGTPVEHRRFVSRCRCGKCVVMVWRWAQAGCSGTVVEWEGRRGAIALQSSGCPVRSNQAY